MFYTTNLVKPNGRDTLGRVWEETKSLSYQKYNVFCTKKGLFHKEQSFETGLALGGQVLSKLEYERLVTWDVGWVAWHTLVLVLGCPPF